MKKITFTLIILLNAFFINAEAKNIDSLQKQLDTASTNRLKAKLYTSIASELIQFDATKTREISYADAGKSIEYVLKAIHFNSRLDDTLAIRANFDCLASAYIIQKKYTQAKWFLLQSNAISRDRRDVPSMINSLMQLASVKIAIKDYKMAEKDFNEAIILSKYQNDVNRQIAIEKCLATLYYNTDRAKEAIATEKHCDYLAANMEQIMVQQAKENKVRAIEQAKIIAQQAKANAVKMALAAKIYKANEAKALAAQAKTIKLEENGYLATLKKQNHWPLVTMEIKPTDVAQAKVKRMKEKKFLVMLKKQNQWPLIIVDTKSSDTIAQATHSENVRSGSENTVLAIVGQDK